jgi:hypothetical protein
MPLCQPGKPISAPAGLFFCRRLRFHTHMESDLESVIRQALETAERLVGETQS